MSRFINTNIPSKSIQEKMLAIGDDAKGKGGIVDLTGLYVWRFDMLNANGEQVPKTAFLEYGLDNIKEHIKNNLCGHYYNLICVVMRLKNSIFRDLEIDIDEDGVFKTIEGYIENNYDTSEVKKEKP